MTISKGRGDKAKATVLHSQIVRARGRCQRCGSTLNLQCAHVVRRSYSWTRTDVDNAWCLCAKCHFAVDGDPHLFMVLVEMTIGNDAYMALRQKAQDGVRRKFDWKNELERLTVLHAELPV